jgi:hypothetical protein
MPNEDAQIKSSHGFEVVTSGGTWIRARGLKDRNHFKQRVVLTGYLCSATVGCKRGGLNGVCAVIQLCLYSPLQESII